MHVVVAHRARHGTGRLSAPGGEIVALVCEITGGRVGPRYELDACLDTAPFGDEAAWTYPSASAQVSGGRLYGRGSSGDDWLLVWLFNDLVGILFPEVANIAAAPGPADSVGRS
jgi:hypothetical protein